MEDPSSPNRNPVVAPTCRQMLRRVLVQARAGQTELQLIEEPDGSVLVELQGEPLPGFRWPRGQLEVGTRAYLRLLRGTG